MNIRGLLIDCNNTLEDCKQHAAVRNQILCQMADIVSANFAPCSPTEVCRFHEVFNESFGSAFWEHHPVFWRSLLRSVMHAPERDEDVEELYRAYLKEYSSRVRLYPDVLPFLKYHAARRQLALVANGNQQRLYAFLAKHNLRQYFSAIVISGECPFQKPEPFPFKLALSELRVTPEESVMIGDRYNTDVAGARTLGIRTIHLNRNGDLPDSCGRPWHCPDAEVRSLPEISELLAQECSQELPPVDESYRREESVVRDAVVVCGGRGKRMLHLTESQQKCTLPLGGIPIIDYLLRALVAVGCRRVFFIVGYRSEDIVTLVGDGTRYGISAQYIRGEFGSTLEATLACVSSLDEWFYYVHANIVFPPRLLAALWLQFCRTDSSTVVLTRSDEGIRHARAQIDGNGWLTSIDATGTGGPNAGLLFVGLAIYARRLFTNIDPRTGMTEIAIGRALEHGSRVSSVAAPLGQWRHYESPEEYERDRDRSPSQIVGW